jgi:protein-disulfide isomerase
MSKARKSAQARARLREQEYAAEQKALEEARSQEALEQKARRRQARAERARARRAALLGVRERPATLAVILVLASLVTAGIVILTKGSAHSNGAATSSSSTQATEALATADSLLAGIPQQGNVLGSRTARLTLQYFGDLQSTACKEFTVGALPTIILKWVRGGQLRIVYRSLQTTTREPRVFVLQQAAALAAGKQNKMWYYVDLLYLEQGEPASNYMTTEYLGNLARQVPGLNLARWARDINDRALIHQMETDRKTAKSMSLATTPTFLLGDTGGKAKELITASLTDPTGFDEAIEHLLKAQPG